MRREDVARAVAEAACAVPGVAGLSSVGDVEISTQFAGGKVLGVRLRSDSAEVHIIAERVPLPPIADEVVRAVAAVLTAAGEPRPVTVVVADVATEALDRRRGAAQ